MSGAEGAAWYVEKEEPSHPQHTEHDQSERQNPPHGRLPRREQTGIHRLPSHRNFSERMGLGANQCPGNASKRPDIPSVLEVGPPRPTVLNIGNSSERGSLPTLALLRNGLMVFLVEGLLPSFN